MQLKPGTTLGRYEILAPLGAGGMGEVYRARDTRLDRQVAIKVLAAEFTQDPTFQKRFEREAKTISQLQHPNVCMLHDIGSEGATQYLVMEYLEGETLEDRLGNGALPVDDVLRIGSEIAEAMEAAHRQGIVHRDLKPGNVMLTKTGTKVLDFGLAREFATPGATVNTQAATVPAITGEGTLVGTMPYMAPEQLQGSQADSRTDIWALGCILYEMATGERRFQGKSQADLIASIMGAQPEPPSRRQPLTPERLDRVVKRCLVKDPEQRWQSSRDLAIELSDLIVKAGKAVKPLIARTPATRAILVVAAVVAVTSAGGWFLLNRGGESREEVEPGLDSESSAVLGQIQPLAVFPFDNDTGDARFDQLAKGLAEDVIDFQIGTFPVVPRTRSFTHAGEDICEAAEGMGAEFALSGSLQGDSDRLRVFAQLIECPKAEILWSDRFIRDVGDVFELQEEVSRLIFSSIQHHLRINRGSYDHPGGSAWYLSQRSREGNAEALRLRRAVIDASPDSTIAWGELFFVYAQAFLEGWWETPEEILAELDRVSESCLGVDSRAYSCQWTSGLSHLFAGRGEKAIAAMEQAVELGNGAPFLHGTLGLALAMTGSSEPALESIGRAIDLSPEDDFLTDWRSYEALAYFAAGDYEKAREAALKCVRSNANSAFNRIADGYERLASSNAHLGRMDEARQALQEAKRLRPGLRSQLVEAVLASADPDLRGRYLDGLRMAGLEK